MKEELQKDRDTAVKRLEDAVANHQWEMAATKIRADVALAGMHEMDDMIAGNLLDLFRLFFTVARLTHALQLALPPII